MKTKSVTEKNMKVCLVGSSGGHLTHLYMLKPFWKDKNHFWVTFDKEDSEDYQLIREDYSRQYDGLRAALKEAENKKVEVERQIEEYLDMTAHLEEHLDSFGFDICPIWQRCWTHSGSSTPASRWN